MIVQFCRYFSLTSIRMVRILNVAEKNDAAKSLAEIMSRGRYRKREGFSKFNKIYEFEYNILNQQNSTMTMTSVSGHLLNFEFAAQYKGWHSCNPVALFDAPVKKFCPDNYTDIKRTLEREVRGCQSLIVWTDCDREGENIGFEIIQVCKAVKPSLKVYRARFSEITPQAVQRAVSNLLPPDQNTSDAVEVRQELDLRIGASFTRFQTLRLQKVFPDVLAEQLISYGSCQFPTLGFVVERYKEVQAFVPEPFWKIKVQHEDEDGVCDFNWKRQRLFDHLACLVLYQHCIEKPEAKVLDVKSKPKSKWRPAALDTVELEKLASRKLRINAKETMKIAEKLYTQGYISYPRTETNIFPKDIDLAPLVEMQTQDNQWGGFAAGILERGGPTPRNGNKSDQAHPPIHPIKYTNNLQGNERKIYEFIVRHFLACCSQDAQGHETTIEITVHDELFSASGLMIIAKNYLEVYIYDKWNAKVIPVFERGETFMPSLIEMSQGETSPPSLLTEADLISLMDKHGIGTDATHAEHIETIKARLYVGVRDDGRFVPGELGMGLVEGYDAMGYQMSKPHLRSELEADLKRICQGQRNSHDVLKEQIEKYKQVFIEATKEANKIDEALSQYFGNAQQFNPQDVQVNASDPVRPCPNCGAHMVIKTKKDNKGLFVSCMGYPDCRNVLWLPDFVIAASVEQDICTSCQPGPVHKVKFKFKKGSVPAYMSTEYVGCLSCDSMLKEVLDVRISSNTAKVAPSQSTNNRSVPTSRPKVKQEPRTSAAGPGVLAGRAGGGNNRDNMGGRGNNRGSMGGGSNPGSSSVEYACNCGETAVLRTVKKEGANCGREFYACPKPMDSKCNFFQWADQDPPSQRAPLATNNRTGSGNNSSGWGGANASGGWGGSGFPNTGGGDGHNAIQCSCGDDAKQLTVRKEGPNCGRQFYVCSKPQDTPGRCTFFLWGDDTPDEGGGAGGGGDCQDNNSPRNNDNQRVLCKCNKMAKRCTVQKEGPNKGRDFFGCPKPREEQCGFFQWADEVANNNRGRAGGGGGFGGGGGVKRDSGGGAKKRPNMMNQDQPKKKRKCGLCGEEGHTKKTCPHR